jgi:hypothetical protein
LTHFWEKLSFPNTSCTFVSTDKAYQLDELADRARRAAAWEEFEQVFIKPDGQSNAFNDLCQRWGGCLGAEAFAALKRIYVVTIGEDTLRTFIESRLAALVEGDSATVADILTQLALDTVHQDRLHLKQVVCGLLAQLPDPTEDEWRILASLMSPPGNDLAHDVWRTLRGASPWFLLLDSLGMFKRWLTGPDEELVDQAVLLLSSVQRQLPDRVAELVAPYVGTSERWNKRPVYIVQWAEIGASRRFFDLFLLLIDRGVLDDARGPITVNSDFWNLIYSLPSEHPDWSCEVIGHYLRRRLEISLALGQPNPFDRRTEGIPNSQLDDEIFMKSARGAPLVFVKEVLPFMLGVMTLTADRASDPPWLDPVWRYPRVGERYGSSSVLLAAMEAALSDLSANNPEVFAVIAENLSTKDFQTCQFLLIRAYAANGERFANDAAAYLCEKPSRLHTGYIDNAYWATRQLLEAITPHFTAEWLAKLEEVILNYYSKWERSVEGHRTYGYGQLILLEGIAPSRRSTKATRQLEEWRRKFGAHVVEPPRPIEGGWVGSPIPEQAAGKMTDKQWLNAICRYSRDTLRFMRSGEPHGGVYQMAALLRCQVKEKPVRFAKLAGEFPDDAHTAYFEAVLQGVVKANLDDVHLVLELCKRCHRLPGRPCGRWICQPIARVSKQVLPQEALDIIAWYATEDPDPEQELWRTSAPGGTVYYGGDILTAAINSVRGSAAEAMSTLIFADGNRLAYFLPFIERMVRDPSVAVRSCVASVLIAVLKHERDIAIGLFERLCNTEDVLLKTHYVERFLFYALQTHFERLRPVLERMLMSQESEVATVGARQACLASLFVDEARPLAERCIAGTEAQQMGAAEVFAVNLHMANVRSVCEEGLKTLFNSPYEKVRSKTGTCFQGFTGDELGACVGLIEAFVRSPAFANHCFHVIHALDQTTAKLPVVMLLTCEQFLTTFGQEAGDIRTYRAADADTVCRLIIRAYNQASDEELQTRCLDVIDRMVQTRAFGFEKTLALFER